MILVLFLILVGLFIALPLVGLALWTLWTTIVVGLILGALGRLIVPGPQRIGFLATLVAGLCGSIVGGFLGQHVLDVGRLATVLLEIGIAALAVAGFAAATNRRVSNRRGSRRRCSWVRLRGRDPGGGSNTSRFRMSVNAVVDRDDDPLPARGPVEIHLDRGPLAMHGRKVVAEAVAPGARWRPAPGWRSPPCASPATRSRCCRERSPSGPPTGAREHWRAGPSPSRTP